MHQFKDLRTDRVFERSKREHRSEWPLTALEGFACGTFKSIAGTIYLSEITWLLSRS
jgi:hypothetical protein